MGFDEFDGGSGFINGHDRGCRDDDLWGHSPGSTGRGLEAESAPMTIPGTSLQKQLDDILQGKPMPAPSPAAPASPAGNEPIMKQLDDYLKRCGSPGGPLGHYAT